MFGFKNQIEIIFNLFKKRTVVSNGATKITLYFDLQNKSEILSIF